MEIKDNSIILNKEINNLDKFTIDFTKILQKHTDYVLVSGYVSILFGRSRISEDIDLLIPTLEKDEFLRLYNDLLDQFWCINGENIDELYDMLCSKHSIRFAYKEKVIPNMEVKFANTIIDKAALKKRIKVSLPNEELHISPIELQIAYKEIVLASDKDKEDALHLREVFKDSLKEETIKYYEKLIKEND